MQWIEPKEGTVHEASRLTGVGSEHEQGQNAVEYVLIVALMALAITLGMRAVALELQNAFTQVAATISNALADGSSPGLGGGPGNGGGHGNGGGNGGGKGSGK